MKEYKSHFGEDLIQCDYKVDDYQIVKFGDVTDVDVAGTNMELKEYVKLFLTKNNIVLELAYFKNAKEYLGLIGVFIVAMIGVLLGYSAGDVFEGTIDNISDTSMEELDIKSHFWFTTPYELISIDSDADEFTLYSIVEDDGTEYYVTDAINIKGTQDTYKFKVDDILLIDTYDHTDTDKIPNARIASGAVYFGKYMLTLPDNYQIIQYE